MMRMYAAVLMVGFVACGETSPTAPVPVPSPSATPAPVAFFSVSGSGCGNSVTLFDTPAHVRRVRVQASNPGLGREFKVRIGGTVIVNETLGTTAMRTYVGLHNTSGIVQVTISGPLAQNECRGNDLQWSLSEEP